MTDKLIIALAHPFGNRRAMLAAIAIAAMTTCATRFKAGAACLRRILRTAHRDQEERRGDKAVQGTVHVSHLTRLSGAEGAEQSCPFWPEAGH